MTVEPSSGSGAVAVPSDEYDDVGLEDVGVGDVVIPRIQIVHNEAVFKNNLSGETYETLDVVILGLVKQRIMWDDEVDDGDKPLCKSPDFTNGFPNTRDDVPKDKRFPWATSNFNPEDFSAEQGLNGFVTLPCNSCIFKEWDKGNWRNPPCAEQHTYPLLFSTDEWETWSPALYTVQKTGIKPSRQYISSFAQSKTPMFTVHTTLSLQLMKRGTVTYSVPVFRKGKQSDREQWSEFANQYRNIRDFVRQPPRRQDEEEEGVPSDNTNKAPEPSAAAPAGAKSSSGSESTAAESQSQPAADSQPASSSTTPAPAAAPAAQADDDDDLPF